MNRIKGLIFIFFAVLAFLEIRKWIDRKKEKLQDVEIIREDMDDGDAHLGSWAQKNDRALIRLRLKRNGLFTYEVVESPANDTIRYAGKHRVISTPGYKGVTYPRLLAVSDQGDTIINHFVSLSRATRKAVDILELRKDNHPDAAPMLFYRVQQ